MLFTSASNSIVSKAERSERDLDNRERTFKELVVAQDCILNALPETDVRLSQRSKTVWNASKGITRGQVRRGQH